jgi:hypothetical protein
MFCVAKVSVVKTGEQPVFWIIPTLLSVSGTFHSQLASLLTSLWLGRWAWRTRSVVCTAVLRRPERSHLQKQPSYHNFVTVLIYFAVGEFFESFILNSRWTVITGFFWVKLQYTELFFFILSRRLNFCAVFLWQGWNYFLGMRTEHTSLSCSLQSRAFSFCVPVTFLSIKWCNRWHRL